MFTLPDSGKRENNEREREGERDDCLALFRVSGFDTKNESSG